MAWCGGRSRWGWLCGNLCHLSPLAHGSCAVRQRCPGAHALPTQLSLLAFRPQSTVPPWGSTLSPAWPGGSAVAQEPTSAWPWCGCCSSPPAATCAGSGPPIRPSGKWRHGQCLVGHQGESDGGRCAQTDKPRHCPAAELGCVPITTPRTCAWSAPVTLAQMLESIPLSSPVWMTACVRVCRLAHCCLLCCVF